MLFARQLYEPKHLIGGVYQILIRMFRVQCFFQGDDRAQYGEKGVNAVCVAHLGIRCDTARKRDHGFPVLFRFLQGAYVFNYEKPLLWPIGICKRLSMKISKQT